jgi:putative ABC transport system permease protein
LLQDLRYGARLLQRNPVFALTAALSLAIGIGATTTVFTVANGLLLRSAVGVSDPGSLVEIVRSVPGDTGVKEVSYPDYREIRRRTTTLQDLYGYALSVEPVSLRVGDSAQRVFANFVTPNFFTVLGVPAAAGRVFAPADSEERGASPLAVLGYRFWASQLDGDPAVIGRTVRVNGHPFAVIGVAAADFRGLSVVSPDLWLPASMRGTLQPDTADVHFTSREIGWLMLGGRLAQGVSRRQASQEIGQLAAAIDREFPIQHEFIPPGLEQGPSQWSAEIASPIPSGLRLQAAGFLSLLLAIVAVVLVIACANLAGILLARATVRRREIALRAAIGAARSRVVRQLVTETMLLFGLGAAMGLALARAMTTAAASLLPAFPLPVSLSLPLDARVVFFSLLVSFVAALLSGIAPAWHASRTDVVSALKDESPSYERLRLRNAFVVAQVTFSMLLVVTAGMLVKGLNRVASVERGFDARGVDIVSVDLTMAGYTSVTGSLFAQALVDRVRALPGVVAATLADRTPSFSSGTPAVTVPGVRPPNGAQYFYPNWTLVDSGYFSTLRIPLLAGRDFTRADGANAEPVAIVSERTAQYFWPDKDPIGQFLLAHSGNLWASPRPPAKPVRVIGVVRDLVFGSRPSNRQLVSPVVYVPLQQRYSPAIVVLARSEGGGMRAGELRALVTAMNRDLPALTAQTLEAQQDGPVEGQLRIGATVAASVGLVGLLLAAIGVYGVTAYTVTRRTREIGIRLSLGAGRGSVSAMVVRESMFLVAIGAATGLLIAVGAGLLLSRAWAAVVQPPDAMMMAAAAALFAFVGLLACSLPVRRAIRIHPMDALRYE